MPQPPAIVAALYFAIGLAWVVSVLLEYGDPEARRELDSHWYKETGSRRGVAVFLALTLFFFWPLMGVVWWINRGEQEE